MMQPLIPRQVLNYTEGQFRSCEPSYCDLWLLSAEVNVPERKILESVLSTNERQRANQFRFEADRVRSIVARGGLRRILSSYSCASPHLMEFRTESHGKPTLVEPYTNLEFNVSHSGGCVLIAVSSGVRCGVDIEHSRPIIVKRQIADRLFCAREVNWLSGTENGFHRLWAMKEAIIKAVGLGLSCLLSDFDLTDVLERKTSSISIRSPKFGAQTLWPQELFLLSDYSAAVATVRDPCTLRFV